MEYEAQDIFGQSPSENLDEKTVEESKHKDDFAKKIHKSTTVLVENNISTNITLPEEILDFVINNDERKNFIDIKIVNKIHLILMPKRGRHDTNLIVFTKHGTYIFSIKTASRKDLEEPDTNILISDPKVAEIIAQEKEKARQQELLLLQEEEDDEDDDELEFSEDLEQLTQLSQLQELSRLKELTKLQELQKLSSVLEMHKMYDLLQLKDLSKLSELSQLANLSQLAKLTGKKKKKKKIKKPVAADVSDESSIDVPTIEQTVIDESNVDENAIDETNKDEFQNEIEDFEAKYEGEPSEGIDEQSTEETSDENNEQPTEETEKVQQNNYSDEYGY